MQYDHTSMRQPVIRQRRHENREDKIQKVFDGEWKRNEKKSENDNKKKKKLLIPLSYKSFLTSSVETTAQNKTKWNKTKQNKKRTFSTAVSLYHTDHHSSSSQTWNKRLSITYNTSVVLPASSSLHSAFIQHSFRPLADKKRYIYIYTYHGGT